MLLPGSVRRAKGFDLEKTKSYVENHGIHVPYVPQEEVGLRVK